MFFTFGDVQCVGSTVLLLSDPQAPHDPQTALQWDQLKRMDTS